MKKDFEIKNDILKDLADKDETYTIDIIDFMNEIQSSKSENYGHIVYMGLLFEVLAEKNINIFIDALKHYQKKNYRLIDNGSFVSTIIENKLLGVEKFYNLIGNYVYEEKQFLSEIFFRSVNEIDINKDIFLNFIKFINSLNGGFHFFNPEEYLKFDKCFLKFKNKIPFVDKTSNVIQYMTKILIDNPNDISLRFNHGFCQEYNHFFEDNFELLRDVFYINIEKEHNWDYDGKELESLCTINPSFLMEYLKYFISSEKIRYLRHQPKLYFIWNGSFSEEDIDEIIDLLINKQNYFYSVEHPITILFKGTSIEHNYITKFIKVNKTSKKHIHAIFSMILYTFDEKYFMKFLKKFLILNNDIEIFKCISLIKSEVKFSSFSSLEEEGVVSYQKILDMVENLPNISNFSKHVSYLNDLISQNKENINSLKKDEFKDDFP